MNKKYVRHFLIILIIAMCSILIRVKHTTDSQIMLQDESSIITLETEADDLNEQYIYDEQMENETEQEEIINYSEHSVPNTSGFKSYMSHKSITKVNSLQYSLRELSHTGLFGIRQYENRFCIAIGTAYGANVGTYVDLVLENGIIIECIIGDIKAAIHTDSSNKVSANGCVSEFIVDTDRFHYTAKKMGDVSYCNDDWQSPVKKIIIYNYNIFDTN